MNGNEMAKPLPIPDLDPAPPASGVTDEDRNRFGVLLDHAAERGLLSPAEYQCRLAELAGAASVDELQRIVTELPAFGGVVASGQMPGPSPGPSPGPKLPGTAPGTPAPEIDAALWANLTPAVDRRRWGNPWVVLAVLVVVLAAALVGLALVAAHVAHTQTHAASPIVRELSGLSPLHL